MVGGQDNDRILVTPSLLQVVKKHTKLVVALLDQPHIGDDGLGPCLFVAKGLGDLVGEEGFIDGVGVLAFRLVTYQRLDVVRPVNVVIGRWHDIGPVWLDEADMSAPRALGLVDEPDGLACQPGRFAVLFADVGRLIRIFNEPARGQPPVFDRPVGISRPRVVRIISLFLEIAVIRAVILAIIAIPAIPVQSVIPHPRVEPAFGLAHADDAVLRNAKPRHAFLVCLHVCLAEKPAGHVVLPQMIAKRDLADPDGKFVPASPVACHIAAGIGRHAAGPADR